jgi:hypothetical protein
MDAQTCPGASAAGADPVSKVYQLDFTDQRKQNHTFLADPTSVVGEKPFPRVEFGLQYEIFFACSNGEAEYMQCKNHAKSTHAMLNSALSVMLRSKMMIKA